MKINDKFMSSPVPNLSPSLIVRGLRVTTKDGSGSSKSMSQQSLYILAFDVQSERNSNSLQIWRKDCCLHICSLIGMMLSSDPISITWNCATHNEPLRNGHTVNGGKIILAPFMGLLSTPHSHDCGCFLNLPPHSETRGFGQICNKLVLKNANILEYFVVWFAL